MRFDTRVIFIHQLQESHYDPELGQAVTPPPITATRACRVYDMSTDRKIQLYGRTDIAAATIYHQGDPVAAETVQMAGLTYTITSRRRVRGKATYTVREAKA